MKSRNTINEILAVVQAIKDGKQIQYWYSPCGHRADDGSWQDCVHSPVLNFADYIYRVKSEVKKVPLTQADIPLDRPVWIKFKGCVTSHLVTSVNPAGLSVADSTWEFKHLMNESISFDSGKTWQKCKKKVAK